MGEGMEREVMRHSGLELFGLGRLWTYLHLPSPLAFGDSDRLCTQTLKEE